MRLVFKPDVCTADNLKSSLIIPCCKRANSGLCPLTITVTLANIASVRIICSVVALTKDPEAIPSHGVSSVVMEFIKVDLVGTVVSGP